MCMLEGVDVGTSARSALAGRAGLPGAVKLTQPEVMAMLSSLPWEEAAVAGAVLYGEQNSTVLLWGWLNQIAALRAAEEGWKPFKKKPVAPYLAKVAVEVLCHGEIAECEKARRLGMTRESFYNLGWNRRLEWLVNEGVALAARATARLRLEMYGEG